MEAELESDKSGPVCIVNRYRHYQRQRMMESNPMLNHLPAAAGRRWKRTEGENEQNDQHTSFAAGSHEFQESPSGR